MWQETSHSLEKTFTFPDFIEALSFIVKVGFLSEKMNHHPTITNTFNTVTLTLTTHDAGNIVTEKDREMADIIDSFN